MDVRRTLHAKPFSRRDQLIPVNKAVNEKKQLEKGLEEEKTDIERFNRDGDSCRLRGKSWQD
jgi:hypothetical protein